MLLIEPHVAGRYGLTVLRPWTIVWTLLLSAAAGGQVTQPAALDESEPVLEVGVLPHGDVFEPLWADPIWPMNSASYHRYIDDDFLGNVAAFNIGITMPIYRWHEPKYVPGVDYFEWGLQAAIQSDFDQDRQSRDQFSADYSASGYLAARRGPTSAMLRLYHRSSHVGDEYLTNDSGVEREDFAFERFDLIVSYDVLRLGLAQPRLARVYGGVGRTLQRPTPNEWGYYRLQWGGEVQSGLYLGDSPWRPVAAFNVTHQEGNDFKPDFSLRAGLQADHPTTNGRNIRLLLEFYNGKDPNGQFFEDDVLIIGTGVFFSL